MKRGNPDKIKGQGFHTNPERINRKGAPKKLPALDVIIAEVLGDETGGIPAAQAILNALRTKARKGDVRAAEALLNRAYGLPKQTLGFTDKDGKDIIPIVLNPAPNCQPLTGD